MRGNDENTSSATADNTIAFFAGFAVGEKREVPFEIDILPLGVQDLAQASAREYEEANCADGKRIEGPRAVCGLRRAVRFGFGFIDRPLACCLSNSQSISEAREFLADQKTLAHSPDRRSIPRQGFAPALTSSRRAAHSRHLVLRRKPGSRQPFHCAVQLRQTRTVNVYNASGFR